MRTFPALAILLFLPLGGCAERWNDPYPAADRGRNTLYSAFTERPKHLDPTQSYTTDEAIFIAQVYEPPLQYHYLKRPYTLIPMTAESMPIPRYFDERGNPVEGDEPAATSVYEIRIRQGILYQPHPAFARDSSGAMLYGSLSRDDLRPPSDRCV